MKPKYQSLEEFKPVSLLSTFSKLFRIAVVNLWLSIFWWMHFLFPAPWVSKGKGTLWIFNSDGKAEVQRSSKGSINLANISYQRSSAESHRRLQFSERISESSFGCSCLGLLIFLIYNNDFPKLLTKFTLYYLSVLVSHKSKETTFAFLTEQKSIFCTIGVFNNVHKLRPHKIKLMQFHPNHRHFPQNDSIYLPSQFYLAKEDYYVNYKINHRLVIHVDSISGDWKPHPLPSLYIFRCLFFSFTQIQTSSTAKPTSIHI